MLHACVGMLTQSRWHARDREHAHASVEHGTSIRRHSAVSTAGPKKGTGTVSYTNHHYNTSRRRSQSPFSGSRIYSLSYFFKSHSTTASSFLDSSSLKIVRLFGLPDAR